MRTLFEKLNKKFFGYIAKKQFKKAEQIIEEMVESGLYKCHIYYYQGRLEHAKGNYLKALNHLNKAIKIRSGNYLDYIAKGNIYYDMEKYKDALREYYKAYTINKKDEVINFNIAMSLWCLERYKEAVKFFNRAIQCSKKMDVVSAKFLGNSLESLGRFEEALKLYTKAIKKFPLDAELYVLKGDCLKYLDKFSEADKYITKAIKIMPDKYYFYYKASNLHLWAEDIKKNAKKERLFREALKWYSRCIRSNVEIKESILRKRECSLALKAIAKEAK